jgi:N-acetylmuramoyl-L-alanine amidase
MKVVIDPGHGGSKKIDGSSANNATGPGGTLEKNVTLALGLLLRDKLQALGETVLMTRSSDVNLGLAKRAGVAKVAAAEVFVSIHLNGWSTPAVQGTETYAHTQAGPASRALAECVQKALLKATGLKNRGVKREALGVINPASHHASTAAVLTEISFLTDPAEEQRLATPAYRDAVATALAAGIRDYKARFLPSSQGVPEAVAVELEDGCHACRHSEAAQAAVQPRGNQTARKSAAPAGKPAAGDGAAKKVLRRRG